MGLLDDKKRTNIAAYVISMWHVEDLMRANAFDLERIADLLVAPMDADEDTKAETRTWYAGIVQEMRAQGIEHHGHLAEVEEVIEELELLHNTLVNVIRDPEYTSLFAEARPSITALQNQADDLADGPVTTCFTAIYGVLLIRAQGKPVSEATTEAEKTFRKLLEVLSERYNQLPRLPGVSLN